jgi:uncharacterized peroxidase-related enzyme
MSFISTTPPAVAEGEVLAMYRRQEENWGYVPNYARLFSHRPEVMGRWASLLAGIRRPVDGRRFELVTLAAALALRNSYCCLAHGQALTAHLPQEDVIAIAEGREADVLAPDEAAVVAFARKVAAAAGSVTADDVEALRRHRLTDADVFDVVAVAAGRAFFTRMLDGLGALADVQYRDLDPALREALTVGRPIASADATGGLDAATG